MDIAPFFTNDATLHIVVGQLNGSHRALGRHFTTHALHRCHEDHLSLLLSIIHRFALQFINQASQVLADITLGHMHQLAGSILLSKASDFLELGLLPTPNLTDLILQLVDLCLAPAELLTAAIKFVEFAI